MILINHSAALLALRRLMHPRVIASALVPTHGVQCESSLPQETNHHTRVVVVVPWMGPFLSKNTNDASVAPVAVVGGLETDRFHREDNKQLKSDKEKKKSISRRTWEEKFALLRLYKKVHGNVNPPPTYVTPCGVKLGGWVATQRKEYAKYQAGVFSMIINDRRIARLERAGFEWQPTTNRLLSVWLTRALGQFATDTFVHHAPFTVRLTSDARAVAYFG